MKDDQLLRVGIISSTHGIRGEVKVFPTTDDVSRFQELKEVLVEVGNDIKAMQISGVRFFKNMVIVKFKGIDDINQVEEYKGKDLFVTRENAVPLKEGEFFLCDIIGALVVTEDGQKLGTLTEVLETGANQVYIVETEDKKEILLPAIPECVLNVDTTEKLVTVHLMPGLI